MTPGMGNKFPSEHTVWDFKVTIDGFDDTLAHESSQTVASHVVLQHVVWSSTHCIMLAWRLILGCIKFKDF